jgi:hypothetical protein
VFKQWQYNGNTPEAIAMWYAVKMLFATEIDNAESPRPLFEKSIRLFEASSEAEAIQKAVITGKTARLTYENDQGERVSWKFVRLVEVQDLCETTLYDGVEVFSELSWSDDSEDRVATT